MYGQGPKEIESLGKDLHFNSMDPVYPREGRKLPGVEKRGQGAQQRIIVGREQGGVRGSEFNPQIIYGVGCPAIGVLGL